MNYLVDTNILTRLAEPGHAIHKAALDAVKTLARDGHRLHIVPQNLYEFWVVCTRPTAVNGLGKTAAEAVAELANLTALFSGRSRGTTHRSVEPCASGISRGRHPGSRWPGRRDQA